MKFTVFMRALHKHCEFCAVHGIHKDLLAKNRNNAILPKIFEALVQKLWSDPQKLMDAEMGWTSCG